MTYGSRQELLSLQRHDTGEVYTYHYDGSGNVKALVDQNGIVLAAYQYAAFGEVVQEFEISEVKNENFFNGQQFDAETKQLTHTRKLIID